MARRTPQEKKNTRYKKERRTGTHHGYVKNYPNTKARINRASRREAETILKSAGIRSLESAVELTDEQALTRERLQHSVERKPGNHFKAHQYTLKEWVGSRLERRVRRAGWDRYFARAYNSAMHRERFSRYLDTILSGRSARSAQVARFYKEVLSPSGVEEEWYHSEWRAWLRAFFRDEPGYEQKLNAWIQEMDRLYPMD